MTKRNKINLLAALIVAGGGASLYGASPAHAANVLDPCDRLAEAVTQEQAACESKNGTYTVQESYCTATGYGLKGNCQIQMY